MENVLCSFGQYLKQNGYSEFTPSGNKSTVYDYQKRVERICKEEFLEINGLAMNIDEIIAKYDTGGSKESFGKQSHDAYKNALKAFKHYLSDACS